MLGGLGAAARREAAPLFVSRYGGVTAPPLLFRRSLFGELMAWTGEGCGKAVGQRHKAEGVYLDWPSAALTDVDTPEDFTAAQALLAGRGASPLHQSPQHEPHVRRALREPPTLSPE